MSDYVFDNTKDIKFGSIILCTVHILYGGTLLMPLGANSTAVNKRWLLYIDVNQLSWITN